MSVPENLFSPRKFFFALFCGDDKADISGGIRSFRYLRFVFSLLCMALSCLSVPSWAMDSATHFLYAGTDGRVWSWGSGEYGQLGLGGRSLARIPQRVDMAASVASVARGGRHSVALDVSGVVWAWGDNSAGQLGSGSFKRVASPSKVLLEGAVAIASGALHSVALDNEGQVWVWGSGVYGQLGNGKHDAFSVSARPIRVEGMGKVVAIASGAYHLMALGENGAVWLWGAQRADLGKGFVVLDRPVVVDGLTSVRSISAGEAWSQAIGKDGTIWVWGRVSVSGEEWEAPHVRSAEVMGDTAVPAVVSGSVRANGHSVAGAVVSVDGEFCGRADGHGAYHCLIPVGFRGELKVRKEGFAFPAVKMEVNSAELRGVDVSGKLNGDFLKMETMFEFEKKLVASSKSPSGGAAGLREKSMPNPVKVSPPLVAKAVEVEKPKVVVTEAVKEVIAPLPVQVTAVATDSRISGNVRLSGSRGSPVSGVQVSGERAKCGKTNDAGEYACTVPPGWSGRLSAAKRDYRFSPNALFFRDVREDRPEQDFVADYGPN